MDKIKHACIDRSRGKALVLRIALAIASLVSMALASGAGSQWGS